MYSSAVKSFTLGHIDELARDVENALPNILYMYSKPGHFAK